MQESTLKDWEVDMSLGENIKRKRLELGYTLEDIAKRLNTSRQTIHRYETGVISNIPSDKIELLADMLDVSPAFLMGWDSSEDVSFFSGQFIAINKRKLPLLGQIACGEPTFAEQGFEGYIEADNNIKADFALKVKGDSMIGACIRDGDVVFIHKQDTIEQGEIAAVLVGDEATLKRYFRYGDTVVLRPENSAYKDIEVKIGEDDNIRIIGKAVAFQSNVR